MIARQRPHLRTGRQRDEQHQQRKNSFHLSTLLLSRYKDTKKTNSKHRAKDKL
jgi:hypothetical protein